MTQNGAHIIQTQQNISPTAKAKFMIKIGISVIGKKGFFKPRARICQIKSKRNFMET